MTVLSLLAQGASLGFSATVAPGPFLAYVISLTLARGWRHSIALMAAPLVSDLPIVVIAVFVLGQLPAAALRVIQVAGGLFVLYLASGMARTLRSGASALALSDASAPPKHNILLHGAAINFFGPGAWLFWSTVNGPIVVSAWRQSPAAAIGFVASFYAVLVLGIGAWIAVFHQARRLDPRVVRGLLALSAGIMAVFGVLLLRAGLTG